MGTPLSQSRGDRARATPGQWWEHPKVHGGLGNPVPPPVPRYGFLLDKALIICKRRGDSYEAKDIVDLQSHQLRDGDLGPRDGKKVPWDPDVP